METNKTYKSKIGLEILIPMILIFGVILTLVIINGEWSKLIFIGLISVFISTFFINTTYKITSDNKLKIRSGLLRFDDINIFSIKKITPTKSLISSPALSIDRLEIFYNKYDSILVSPTDKKGFIESLRKINPEIEIKR